MVTLQEIKDYLNDETPIVAYQLNEVIAMIKRYGDERVISERTFQEHKRMEPK